VEPVSFIERICRDITEGVQIQNCRYVKRLTPITGTEKANIKGLETVAKQVLAPHFHVPDQPGKKVSHFQPLLIQCTARM
jgi:tRNA acetyltransferase TAN1